MILLAQTRRAVAKIEAVLIRPCGLRSDRRDCREKRLAVVPLAGETVAQFVARVTQEHCGSITQARDSVIEIRVVAEEVAGG